MWKRKSGGGGGSGFSLDLKTPQKNWTIFKEMYAENNGLMYPYFQSFPQEVQRLEDFSCFLKPNASMVLLYYSFSMFFALPFASQNVGFFYWLAFFGWLRRKVWTFLFCAELVLFELLSFLIWLGVFFLFEIISWVLQCRGFFFIFFHLPIEGFI